MGNFKLAKDFGVRALLAVIVTGGYEVIILGALVMLYLKNLLDFQGALTIAGLAQAPALLALGFYFGTRAGQPPTNTTP